jgi:Kef-type K+ transport system membrane component KefB
MEMKVLRSRVGIGLLGAAVFDDVLVVLGLSIFVAFALGSAGGWLSVAWIASRMLLFLVIATAVGIAFLPRLGQIADNLPISQGLMSLVLVVTLFYAWSAEVLGGMAAITGALLAGLIFARSPVKERIESRASTVAYSLFVPVFFVNVGLSADATLLTSESLSLFLAMASVAVISKVLGAGLGARIAGFSNREAVQLGAGMTSRGEVGLIVANVGVADRLIGPEIFAVIVGVVIVTTLLTPLMLRSLFADEQAGFLSAN